MSMAMRASIIITSITDISIRKEAQSLFFLGDKAMRRGALGNEVRVRTGDTPQIGAMDNWTQYALQDSQTTQEKHMVLPLGE